MTLVYKMIKATLGLRVSAEEEIAGLDVTGIINVQSLVHGFHHCYHQQTADQTDEKSAHRRYHIAARSDSHQTCQNSI